jgi:hypothetical protein
MLDRIRLPILLPDDPRNLLPEEARRRIEAAHYQALAIRDSALAKMEHLGRRKAAVVLSDSKIESTLAVLSVVTTEFMAIGALGARLENIMRGELEGAANVLELTDLERDSVWSRLLIVSATAASSLRIGLPQPIGEEAQKGAPDQQGTEPRPESMQNDVRPIVGTPKKRGRPTRIPAELKLKALQVKGGTARAQILYETNYPTAQQIKNVPSILKHFLKRCQSSKG